MADFFSALGKSRALETIAGTQERAFQTNLAEIQSGSDLLRTGLEIEEFKQTREANELSLNKARADEENRLQEDARLNTKHPVEHVLDLWEVNAPGTRDELKAYATLYGTNFDDGQISTRDIEKIGEKLKTDTDQQLKLADLSAKSYDMKINALRNTYADFDTRENNGEILSEAELKKKEGLFGRISQLEALKKPFVDKMNEARVGLGASEGSRTDTDKYVNAKRLQLEYKVGRPLTELKAANNYTD